MPGPWVFFVYPSLGITETPTASRRGDYQSPAVSPHLKRAIGNRPYLRAIACPYGLDALRSSHRGIVQYSKFPQPNLYWSLKIQSIHSFFFLFLPFHAIVTLSCLNYQPMI